MALVVCDKRETNFVARVGFRGGGGRLGGWWWLGLVIYNGLLHGFLPIVQANLEDVKEKFSAPKCGSLVV